MGIDDSYILNSEFKKIKFFILTNPTEEPTVIHLPTLSDAVATHARLRPHKLAVRDSRRQMTYAEWDARITRLACGLRSTGMRKGDRVAVLAYNCLEWMEWYAGLARAGLVVVPLNFRLTGAEMVYILTHAEVTALICGPEFCSLIDGIRKELPIQPDRYWALTEHPYPGWNSYEQLIAQADCTTQLEPIEGNDPCALMYTSGTTGRPKGAIRSHGGNTLIALATALEMGFSDRDTALLVMPMCHANSLYFGITFIHMGGSCVIDDRRSFDPAGLLHTLAEERVTFTSLVPTGACQDSCRASHAANCCVSHTTSCCLLCLARSNKAMTSGPWAN